VHTPPTASASASASASVDSDFPELLPVEHGEAQSSEFDVPPLFEMGPQVPAPISPDVTSGVPAIPLGAPRPQSHRVAIGLAVFVGLAGGLGGGGFLLKNYMAGRESEVPRGVVGLVQDAGSSPQITGDHAMGLPVAEPSVDAAMAMTGPVVEDSGSMVNSAVEDSGATALAANEPNDAAVVDSGETRVANAPEDAGSSAIAAVQTPTNPTVEPAADAGAASVPPAPDGVFLVQGTAGLREPDWRIRGGARRAMRERVEPCGQGSHHVARFNVRFDGATGRVSTIEIVGSRFHDTPLGACVEQAARSVQVPTFTNPYWDTDYAVPLR
jgi:hypothetical protein